MLDDLIQNMLRQASNAVLRAKDAHWEQRDADAIDWIDRAQVRLATVRKELGALEVEEVTDGTDDEEHEEQDEAPDFDNIIRSE